MGGMCSPNDQQKLSKFQNLEYLKLTTQQKVSKMYSQMLGPKKCILRIQLYKKESKKIIGEQPKNMQIVSQCLGIIRNQLDQGRFIKSSDTFQSLVQKCVVNLYEKQQHLPNKAIFIEQPQLHKQTNLHWGLVFQHVIKGILLANAQLVDRTQSSPGKKSKKIKQKMDKTLIIVCWSSISQQTRTEAYKKINKQHQQLRNIKTER